MQAGVSARGGRTRPSPSSSSGGPPPIKTPWQQHGKLAPVPVNKVQGRSKSTGTGKQLPRLDILGKNGLLLEAYSGGSWWDAEVIRRVGRVYRIHYVNFTDSDDEQVPANILRLRSRKATVDDCEDGTLSCGVDITVFAAHPHAQDMKGCATTSSAWFDARVMKVLRRPHQRVCNCKFLVEFYEVKDERGDLKNRRLLRGSKTIGISKICVLQKQSRGSLDQLLDELLPAPPTTVGLHGPKGAAKPEDQLTTVKRLMGKYFSAEAFCSDSCVDLSLSTSSESRTDSDSPLAAQPWGNDKCPDAGVSRPNQELPRSTHQGTTRPNYASRKDSCFEDDLYSSSAESFRCWSPERTPKYDAHMSPASGGYRNDTMSARNSEAARPGSTQRPSYQGQKICFSGPKVQHKHAVSRPALVRRSSPRLNRIDASPGRRSSVGGDDFVISRERVLSSTSSMSDSARRRFSPSSDVAHRDPAAREESRQCSTSGDTSRRIKRPSGLQEQAVFIESLPDRKCGGGGIPLRGHQQRDDLPEPVRRKPGESQFKQRGISKRDPLPHMGALEAEKPHGRYDVKGGSHAVRSVDVSRPPSGTVSHKDRIAEGLAKPVYVGGTKGCERVTPSLDVFEGTRPMWKKKKRTDEGKCFSGSEDQKSKRIRLSPAGVEAHSEGKLHKPVEDSGAVEVDERVECSPAVAPMDRCYDGEGEPFMEDLKPSCPVKLDAAAEEAQMWQDYEDMLLEEALSRSVAEKPLATVAETDTTGKRCPKNEHNFFLDESVGLVCSKCAIVGMEIADMVPEIDYRASCRSNTKQEEHEDEDFKVAFASLEFNCGKRLETKKGPDKLNCRLDAIPELAKFLHQHQREGFYFLWKNIGGAGGSSSSSKLREPGGCILAHAPGTGKSFLVISFLKSYLQVNPHRRTLIIAPKSMLRPWEREFRKWKVDISVFILNTAGKSSGPDEQDVVQLKGGCQLPASKVVNFNRLAMLKQWRGKKSILMTTYSMFAKLIDNSDNKFDREQEFIRNALVEIPDLLILDEGHLARNETTKVRKALMSIKTKLRILLSGTLFQNNFSELFNTLYLVRPRFAEDIPDSNNRDVSPWRDPAAAPEDGIDEETEQHSGRKGKCEGAGAVDVESKARRLFTEKFGRPFEIGEDEGPSGVQIGLKKLTKLTKAFVHYHAGRKVLSSLPELREFAVVLMPNKKQQELLEKVPSNLTALQADTTVTSICIHPVLHSAAEPESVIFPKADPGDGVKTLFVVNLVRLCQLRRERVLIFCQKTKPLRLLQHMLTARFNWIMGREIVQVDGSMNLDERQHNIDELNRASSSVQVMLASTKACGEGVSLIGASRLIFLDIEWNPAVYRQAISRAFRLGQKKQVYVYRLIGSHTLEERRYNRAVWKDWVARRIIDATGSGHKEGGEAEHELPSTSQCEDRLLEKLISSSNKEQPWITRVLKQRSTFAMTKNEELQDADREHRSDVVYEVELQQLLLQEPEPLPLPLAVAVDTPLPLPIKPGPGADHSENWDAFLSD